MINTADFIYCFTPSEAATQAEAKGFSAVWPKDDEITLDLDSIADLETFQALRDIWENVFNLWIVDQWESKDGGKHILLRRSGHKFTPLERVAFQACLGSDRKRELLALHLIENHGIEQPSVLFRPPQK